MILIESIKCRQVDGPIVRVTHIEEQSLLPFDPQEIPRDPSVEFEHVVAERYKDITGRTYEIGMTREVREVLGLPMEACQNLHDEVRRLRRALNGYERMTWRQRLAFLFNRAGGGLVW